MCVVLGFRLVLIGSSRLVEGVLEVTKCDCRVDGLSQDKRQSYIRTVSCLNEPTR